MKRSNQLAFVTRKILPAALLAVAILVPTATGFADHGRGGGRGRNEGDDESRPTGASHAAGLLPGFKQINLVADVSGQAPNTDTNLVNPWGLVIGRHGNLIVADNHAGVATFYGPDGGSIRLPVQVDDALTGVTINHFSKSFLITEGTNSRPASLLFATESGKILGWNPGLDPNNAVVAADNSLSNAVYKGIALGHTRQGAMLYATDFHNGKVDMFDGSFHWTGSFTDPAVDAGFAPFNVQNIGGWLFVTFAKQLGPDNEDDEAGAGNGFVDIFRPDGHFARRFAAHGGLNSPWGMAVAPNNFGKFHHALLVGNFGDGRINAYHLRTGAFLGQLGDSQGMPIQIEGLWTLQFGHDFDGDDDDDDDDDGGRNSTLYFTAGPGDESHGLLGVLIPTRRVRH